MFLSEQARVSPAFSAQKFSVTWWQFLLELLTEVLAATGKLQTSPEASLGEQRWHHVWTTRKSQKLRKGKTVMQSPCS